MAHSLTRGDPEVLKELVKLEPIGRLGKPEEIAAAVLWVCSPGASYVASRLRRIYGAMNGRCERSLRNRQSRSML